MTWKIKIKGERYIAEVLADDLGQAMVKANGWRSQGAEVWIEDAHGNKVDEPMVSKSDDQTH
jgi:hypothetical protein